MCTIEAWWAGRVIKSVHGVPSEKIDFEIDELRQKLLAGKFKYTDHSEKAILVSTLCVDVLNSEGMSIKEVNLKS